MSKQSNAPVQVAETDRRLFVRDFGIAALAGGVAIGAVRAEGAPNHDAELVRLGTGLDAAWAVERAAENPNSEASSRQRPITAIKSWIVSWPSRR